MKPLTAYRVLALAALLASPRAVHAAEVLVTALFKPDAANPGQATFTNTTPVGFYCSWVPSLCVGTNLYMFDIPISMTKSYTKGEEIRKRWYISLPPERTVNLRNALGHEATATIAFNAASGMLSPGGRANPVYTASIYGGCSYIRSTNSGANVRFGWSVKNPRVPQPCYSQGDEGASGSTGTFRATPLGIGLKISTNSPLSLQNGIYTGEATYTIGGSGTDLDFGDGVAASDSVLTLRFSFTVLHDLKVTTPPGGDITRLQPLGGWARWSEHGILPKALQSDLPFTITGSAPFSLKLDCEFPVGEQCAIRSAVDGDLAPVDVAISMPGIRSEATGSDANRYRLRANTGRETLMPTSPVAHRPSRLHFNVDGEPMRRMLDQPGSHWQGRATLIFDTEID